MASPPPPPTLRYHTEKIPLHEQTAAQQDNADSTVSTPTAAATTSTSPTDDKKMDGGWNNSATKQSPAPALDLNQAVTNEDDVAGEPLSDNYNHSSQQQSWRDREGTGAPERGHKTDDVAQTNGGKLQISGEIEGDEPRRAEKEDRRASSPGHRSPRVNGSGHGRRSRSPSPRRPYPSRRSMSPSPGGRRSLSRSPQAGKYGRGRDRYARSPSPPSRYRRHGRSRSRSPYYERERYRSRYSPRRRSPPRYPTRRDRSPRRRPWSPPPNRNTGIGKPGNNLFVAGFSFVTSERDLEKKFSRFGRVTDVRIIRDKRSGDSRGFGFLSLERDEDADAAIKALDQTEWNGRIVLVEKAKTN